MLNFFQFFVSLEQ